MGQVTIPVNIFSCLGHLVHTFKRWAIKSCPPMHHGGGGVSSSSWAVLEFLLLCIVKLILSWLPLNYRGSWDFLHVQLLEENLSWTKKSASVVSNMYKYLFVWPKRYSFSIRIILWTSQSIDNISNLVNWYIL